LPPPGIDPGAPASQAGTLPKELSRQLISGYSEPLLGWELEARAIRYIIVEVKVGAERCEYVFDAHTSKASKELKVVLLHFWRVNVKTTRGFVYISLEDFHIDKTAP
jgi:hypothetical protein